MPGPSKRKRLSGLTSRTKAKTKKILRIKSTNDGDSESEEDGPLGTLEHNPAFNPSVLQKRRHFRPGKTAGKAIGAIQTIGNAVVHPKHAITQGATRTAAGQLSKAERPYLSQKSNLELLQAHDDLQQAESTSSSRQVTSDEEQDTLVASRRERIKEMEAHRESLQAAWTTSRHVRRVRVVPKRHIKFPDKEYFVERDENGNVLGYDWLSWLGYVRLYVLRHVGKVLMDINRISSITLRISAHNISMILTSFRLKLILRGITLNGC